MSVYDDGDQPCDDFDPEDGSLPGVRNKHSCCGGGRGSCELSVSWCKRCKKDHHEHGWEACTGILRAELAAKSREVEELTALLREARETVSAATIEEGISDARRQYRRGLVSRIDAKIGGGA